MPTSWILIPGFGAQGGGAADVIAGFDSKAWARSSIVLDTSFLPMHATNIADRFGDARWQDAVAEATREMNEQLRA